MNWRGVHHGYYGLALFLIAGWAALASYGWPGRVVYTALALLGAWVLGDDVYQHIREAHQPGYQSSLHRWFYRQPCARWPIVQRLNRWLDRLLGAA